MKSLPLASICTACISNSTVQQQKPPCMSASPADIHYPSVFSFLLAGHEAKAAELMHRQNPFAALICALTDRLAENACTHQEGRTLFSKLYSLADGPHASLFYTKSEPAAEQKKNIAVIGSGPAGLHAAFTLRLWGYTVFVYEAAPKAGITLLYEPVQESSSASPEGSPAVPERILNNTLYMLENMGIHFETSSPKGQTDLPKLMENFDAVVCACGKGSVLPVKTDCHIEKNLFAAGTCVKNQKLMNALQALASGHKAALAVHSFLEQQH